MDFVSEQIQAAVARHASPASLWYLLVGQASPVLQRAGSTLKDALIVHPDLTSIALVLLIFYISYLFVLRAFRMTIASITLSFKLILLVIIGTACIGAWEAVAYNDYARLDTLCQNTISVVRFAFNSLTGTHVDSKHGRFK